MRMKTLGLATGLVLAVAAGNASAAYGYNNGYDSGYNNNGYGSNGYGSNAYASNGNGQTVRCESRDNRTVYCGVDTSGGVTLVQQISQSSCIRGRTWGADGRGIWVARGCRGTFAINDRNDNRNGYGNSYNNGYSNNGYGNNGYGNNGYNNGYSNNGYSNNGYRGTRAYGGQTVRCESSDGRTRYCGIDTQNGVTIVNQRSHQPCIEGRTWGASGNRVWVTNGCRADFASGSGRYGYSGNGYDPRY